jgi:hypothetical protein
VEPFGRQEMQLAPVHARVELSEKSVRGAQVRPVVGPRSACNRDGDGVGQVAG